MKHNIKITIILLSMFLLAQLIGLAVIYAYHPVKMPVEINGTMQNVTTNPLPYGLEPPEVKPESSLISILFAFAIAFTILFFIMRLHKTYLVVLMRFWFFAVIAIALGIVINIFLRDYFINSAVISLLIGAFLSFIKVFRRNMILHNLTELAVYPGIAAIIVPILNLPTIIILLVVISVYDLWAVWHSGFMQKLANFQMKEVKVFGGFFVPYMTKTGTFKQISQSKRKNKINENKFSNSRRRRCCIPYNHFRYCFKNIWICSCAYSNCLFNNCPCNTIFVLAKRQVLSCNAFHNCRAFCRNYFRRARGLRIVFLSLLYKSNKTERFLNTCNCLIVITKTKNGI